MVSADRNVSLRCPPASSFTPQEPSISACSLTFSIGEFSLTDTFAPFLRRNLTVSIPVLPTPTTSIFLPLSSIRALFSPPYIQVRAILKNLSQLECRKSEQRQNERNDPESYDYFGLRPAAEFKMMMKRSHLENPLPGELERPDL